MHSGTVVWPPQFREKATPLVTLSLSSSSLQRSFYLLPRICAIVCRLHHLFCVSTVAEAVTTVVKVLPLPQSSELFWKRHLLKKMVDCTHLGFRWKIYWKAAGAFAPPLSFMISHPVAGLFLDPRSSASVRSARVASDWGNVSFD